jgi:hypothetical protein
LNDREKAHYVSNEELKRINDLAKQESEKTGSEDLWKVISHMALTASKLNEAIKATDSKITKKEVIVFLQKQGRLSDDIRNQWPVNAQKINAHPEVIAKLLGHKVPLTLDDDEES